METACKYGWNAPMAPIAASKRRVVHEQQWLRGFRDCARSCELSKQTYLVCPWSCSMGFAQKTAEAAKQKAVNGTIQKVKATCQNEAKNGAFSCTIHVQRKDCSDNVIPQVKKELVRMGFGSVTVKTFLYRIEITVNWNDVKSEERKKTRTEQKGTSSTCPVCLENRPVVALMPCGHVVCQKCQRSHQFRQCPMCRVGVTGATRALFL